MIEPSTTTIGQLYINELLPDELRDYSRVYDKKSIAELLAKLAGRVSPDQYADIVQELSLLGLQTARGATRASFSLKDLQATKAKRQATDEIRQKVQHLMRTEKDPEIRNEKIIEAAAAWADKLPELVYQEGLTEDNPFSLQVLSGARGKKGQLNSMRGTDLLYEDHRKRTIPIPILNSYSEGLNPVEYWAAAYGARAGTVSTNFATAEAGFFGKQLSNATHRLVVTDDDVDENLALAVEGNDPDNIGSVLARDYGPYKKGTPITARMMKYLKRHKNLLVYSPISAASKSGGIPALAAGIRERGMMSQIGDNIGLTATAALAEPISQGMLGAKHGGGVSKGKKQTLTGFDYLEKLVQVPKHFPSAATMTEVDGTVGKIEEAPQGGSYVHIGGEKYYVSADQDLSVEVGDKLEAGDSLSDGIVNPAQIVRLKGVGEGRRRFVKQFVKAMRDNDMPVHRRNVEVLARGLINAVRVQDENVIPGALPNDLISYDRLASMYQPRQGAMTGTPQKMLNNYLEKPILHYTIGTRVTPSVAKELKQYGFDNVIAHPEPPGFEPEMVRARDALSSDQDWLTQMSGFELKRTFLRNVQRGATSDIHSTSFVPALATGEIGKGTKGLY
jgi:DNA-directed RNA polymerase subunit beta'